MQPVKTRSVRGLGKLSLGAALLPMLLGGCSSMSNTDAGVLGGGAIGAVAGTVLGAAVGRPGLGAALGAGAGATAGGISGAMADRGEARAAARTDAAIAAANARPALSLEEIQRMSADGISDQVIINQIRTTGSVYNLSGPQIEWLHTYGVRDPVITEMQATAYRAPRVIYTATPVVAPVYVAPPPPPVAVGIGFGFRGGCR